MRLLLDECLPKDLARELPGHTVKSLPHQQKTKDLPFGIVVLRVKSNRLIHVSPFAAEILRRLPEFNPAIFMFFPGPFDVALRK